MALEQLWRCDVCGVTTPQGEAPGWRRVFIAALEEAPPAQPVEGLPPQLVASQNTLPQQTCVCTKPSCLTSWAKEQNTKAKS